MLRPRAPSFPPFSPDFVLLAAPAGAAEQKVRDVVCKPYLYYSSGGFFHVGPERSCLPSVRFQFHGARQLVLLHIADALALASKRLEGDRRMQNRQMLTWGRRGGGGGPERTQDASAKLLYTTILGSAPGRGRRRGRVRRRVIWYLA